MIARTLACLMIVMQAGGCVSLRDPALAARVDAIPAAQRDLVHVWLINSPIDPLCVGGLPALGGALRDAGFSNVHFHLVPDAQGLASEVRHCVKNRPGAKIALVGWSGGSLAVWDATAELAGDSQTINLIAYLDSNWIVGRVNDRGHPANFKRLLLIYRHDNTPPSIDRAEIVRAGTGNHMAIPTRHETIEALIAALADLAATIEPASSDRPMESSSSAHP